MIPQFQTKLFSPTGVNAGNALSACIASLLESPLWLVPPFEDMFFRADFMFRLQQFAGTVMHSRYVRVRLEDLEVEREFLPEFLVVGGPRETGEAHTVLYRSSPFALAHDPYPGGGGVKEVRFVEYFAPGEAPYQIVVDKMDGSEAVTHPRYTLWDCRQAFFEMIQQQPQDEKPKTLYSVLKLGKQLYAPMPAQQVLEAEHERLQDEHDQHVQDAAKQEKAKQAADAALRRAKQPGDYQPHFAKKRSIPAAKKVSSKGKKQ